MGIIVMILARASAPVPELLSPSAGLLLASDTSPTSSTLDNEVWSVNGNKRLAVTICANSASIGVDLGSAKTVNSIKVFEITNANTCTGFYASAGKTIEVYSSDDNANWELRDTFVGPDLTATENTGVMIFESELILSAPVTARYFKARALPYLLCNHGEYLYFTEIEAWGTP